MCFARAVYFNTAQHCKEDIMNRLTTKQASIRHHISVCGNKFGRTEEFYQCEDCTACPYREECHKGQNNRLIRINEELTEFHKEVIDNLESVHGALLRMNRSIQAEGTYGEQRLQQSTQKRLKIRNF